MIAFTSSPPSPSHPCSAEGGAPTASTSLLPSCGLSASAAARASRRCLAAIRFVSISRAIQRHVRPCRQVMAAENTWQACTWSPARASATPAQ